MTSNWSLSPLVCRVSVTLMLVGAVLMANLLTINAVPRLYR
ncbi:hypothetical protein E2C01_099566 [Portunus trituberculatus]|uniref:Uncharacterized protein n=1 Tax=Portunus trituberculatus TaxID=210409 RepID=A0A5B7KFB0_PORTR|nr:hypothetical protein [Portunus trituberculatus]